MENVLICPDKFKGSLTADEVCDAISLGLKRSGKLYRLVTQPMADGGEGTLSILKEIYRAVQVPCRVHDPLMRMIDSEYAISSDGETALIEMAKASGLQLLKSDEYNPVITTTYGTGELIRHALDRDVKKIVLAIGGSATNDAGMGMAAALGYQFLDSNDNVLVPCGESLVKLSQIRSPAQKSDRPKVVVLCDVDNPLHGEKGAAHVYAAQKGATDAQIKMLDEGLKNFARVVGSRLNADTDFPGAGAAGGLGAGAHIFLNGAMKRGAIFLAEECELEKKIRDCDRVITGEGKLDAQTTSGKAVAIVTQLAKKYGKKVTVICGKCDQSREQCRAQGIDEVIELVDAVTTSDFAIQHAFELIVARISDQ